MAALGARLTNGDSYWFCGGSFIGQRLVLTAAHCIPELGAGYSLDLVRLGGHDLSQDTEVGAVDYRVERIVIHPLYSTGRIHTNDIAILVLDTPGKADEDDDDDDDSTDNDNNNDILFLNLQLKKTQFLYQWFHQVLPH